MRARLRHLYRMAGDTFWILPGAMVVGGILLAVGLVSMDRSGVVPRWLIDSPWLYNGGGTGARTLLGAVASSTIGVAGTVFSITIASLSLAAGQMGPRLLRNFVQDRGNQFTLGAFLGTFSYALMVLRSVRTEDEGPFVPYLSLNIGIGFAFLCVGTLVFFVGHMAGRINVDTVIELVSDDVGRAVRRLTVEDAQPAAPSETFWAGAIPVRDHRRGYLQQLDGDGLATWAAHRNCSIRLLARPGSYIFPGTPVAMLRGRADGVEGAIRDATVLGAERVSSADLEFAVRQLVEVAVRALSPGINDPHTAVGVLDRLGAALCDVAPRHLPSGVWLGNGEPSLVVPAVDYDGLVDAMFHEIRQNAAGDVSVLARMIEVMTAVLGVERRTERIGALDRHAALVVADAERDIANPADLEDVRARHRAFDRLRLEHLADEAGGHRAPTS
ncbi:MAG: DUF2254 domain-containing protein [Gluconacetobacter diazotrophicus]|nr:DUF2254 domain-containing protein [Gluconacetobacter diazotrophicus]